MNQNLSKKWLVAQIKPNSYDLATRNLQRQGFEIFLPKMQKTIRQKKNFINKYLLVFPGYMFVGVNSKDFNWSKINYTYGVSKVLAVNKKPSEISHDLIVALKAKYNFSNELSSMKSLQKGDIIKFYSGPFVDLFARIESIEDKKRIWALLEVMGGNRKLLLQQTEKVEYVKV